MTCFDAIVVGGGHAGIEATRALASHGRKVALLTLNRNKIGAMSCNPAIGGVAKGHLVFEIDALGGLMGHAADLHAIQSRRLNTNKGPAVRSTRVQCDKEKYARWMSAHMAQMKNVTIVEGEACELIVDSESVQGIGLVDGTKIFARAVLITTGTFMRGLMFCGQRREVGGRIGDKASDFLSKSIRDCGHQLRRLKTGTPARLAAKSINFSKLEKQWGDPEQRHFSWRRSCSRLPQLACYITYTNERTHDIIRANFDKSPLFSGDIQGVGPRYCPSVEDKVRRFADRLRHQIFLEPEGLDTNFIYPNGMSTSLPAEIQLEFLRTVEGLENVEIIVPGYAVEYDSIDPTTLSGALMSKFVEGLFFAGQVNRTSGYEEAAAQGLWAGISAARYLVGETPLIPERHRSYIETLICDLTTKGSDEPYRLFTSRSEYRLLLREDNAHERLYELACENNLICEQQKRWHESVLSGLDIAKQQLMSKQIRVNKDRVITLYDWLKRPEVTWESFAADYDLGVEDLVVERLEVDAKYSGYLARQESELRQLRSAMNMKIPQGLSLRGVPSISNEVAEKFAAMRPKNVKEFSNISGVSPAEVLALVSYIKKNSAMSLGGGETCDSYT